MVAKSVVGDGRLFSNVNAAYNDSCERRLPNPMSFGGAGTEPADEPDPLTSSLIEAGFGFIVFWLVTVISNGPRAGYPGRYKRPAGSGQQMECQVVSTALCQGNASELLPMEREGPVIHLR